MSFSFLSEEFLGHVEPSRFCAAEVSDALSRNEISVVSNSGSGSSSGQGQGETGAQEAAEGQQDQEETHLAEEKVILS